MLKLTADEKDRLAFIRLQTKKWIRLRPEAKSWDSAFLLGIIDRLLKLK